MLILRLLAVPAARSAQSASGARGRELDFFPRKAGVFEKTHTRVGARSNGGAEVACCSRSKKSDG